MNRSFILYLMVILFASLDSWGQVGEKVSSVNITNADNKIVGIPYLGEKNLLIFYADPGRPRQNKSFRDYFKTHPIHSTNIELYGIVNMAAAPMLPNSLIRKKAMKEIQGTDGKVYFDTDGVLAKNWKLPEADNNFAVIFINKNREIEFYKAGQLSTEEQNKVLALIKKYE